MKFTGYLHIELTMISKGIFGPIGPRREGDLGPFLVASDSLIEFKQNPLSQNN